MVCRSLTVQPFGTGFDVAAHGQGSGFVPRDLDTKRAPPMTSPRSGKCLCGTITFTAIPVSDEMDACHCSKCRKWTGGVLFAIPCEGLTVNNTDALTAYQSSDWGERVFCRVCGTNLFWRMLDGSMDVVMIQAFDDPENFKFGTEAYIDEKPANYDFANDTKKMTGEEFMAMYPPPEGGS